MFNVNAPAWMMLPVVACNVIKAFDVTVRPSVALIVLAASVASSRSASKAMSPVVVEISASSTMPLSACTANVWKVELAVSKVMVEPSTVARIVTIPVIALLSDTPTTVMPVFAPVEPSVIPFAVMRTNSSFDMSISLAKVPMPMDFALSVVITMAASPELIEPDPCRSRSSAVIVSS